jgi:hypothetical protein
MRALIIALALVGAADAARAATVTGGETPIQAPTPIVPSGARAQAEGAIKDDLGDPDNVTFRVVRVMEAASVRRNAFAQPIDGPVSVVCGQFSSRGRTGGDSSYSWFFVAIKRGRVLWTARGPDEAYYSCEGAGLTPASARLDHTELYDR